MGILAEPMTIHYAAVNKDGMWHEVGDRILPGKEPVCISKWKRRARRGRPGCGQKRLVAREHRAIGGCKKPKAKGNADHRWLSR